jgi:D-galactosaminyltransferase
VSFGFGLLQALLLLVVPGTIVALAARLPVPIAVAVGPALTYGVVGLAIIPFGALEIPWTWLSALAPLVVVTAIAASLPKLLARYRDAEGEKRAVTPRPALLVLAGTGIGAVLIFLAAYEGIPHWQSIPSTWDAVWHANEIRYILDTGQASSTHMGELRNVETHAQLYYPSVFHALAALQCEIFGAAPTTAYTLNSLAVAVWLFPVSAAVLTWTLLRPRWTQWRSAGAAATSAALAASFTAVPYVEFDAASMPNMAGYGVAIPTAVLIMSCLRHRDRIPLAVLALLGVFSVHITGGVVTAIFVALWWLFEVLWRPVRGRLRDFVTLALVAVPALLALLPQFVGVLQQAEVIEGHAFVTHEGKKKALFDAIVQHTRHLNDYPIQNILIALAATGGLILLCRRVVWPLVIWLVLVVSIVHSSAPFGGPIGAVAGRFSDLFYSDPRRLSAVVTMLITAWAGLALFALALLVVAGARRWAERTSDRAPGRVVWVATATVLLVAATSGLAYHYFPRHRHLFGDKYDSVIMNDKDLQAFAYLATLPDAKDTLIGDANTDGTAWMYAVAGLHPLWTHYDYPVQQGPGYQRFIFWAYADDADHDPRIAEAVKALNIRYVLTSTTVVRGFVMPDGLVSLGDSKSWAKIYDNGQTRIYEWRGGTD